MTPFEEFESNYIPEPNSGCWLWIGPLGGPGYGSMLVHGEVHAAHRLAWEFYEDEDPSNRLVLHKCHNRMCVNHGHLYLGDYVSNSRDMLLADRCGTAKLTVKQVLEIASLKGSAPHETIAARYGVSRRTIGMIMSGRSWSLVTGIEPGTEGFVRKDSYYIPMKERRRIISFIN